MSDTEGAGGRRDEHQDAVCEFVRGIVSSRSREQIRLVSQPDRERRDVEAVDELWESETRRYAVEHTLIESFDGQLENIARIERLLVPVKNIVAGRLPGRFALAVREVETSAARVDYASAHQEIVRLIFSAAEHLNVGETVSLRSELLPFELRLNLRFREDSQLILYTDIEGDSGELRSERLRRALAKKCPKLSRAAKEHYITVLILEADDIQLSNVWVVYEAFAARLRERDDHPTIAVLVETDASPWSGWVLKEGQRWGGAVPPKRDGGYLYQRGQAY